MADWGMADELGMAADVAIRQPSCGARKVSGATPFGQAVLRLKQQVGEESDKAIGEVLGLSPPAFAGRKRRGSFPEDKLYALCAKRPELLIDAAYVLTGVRSA